MNKSIGFASMAGAVFGALKYPDERCCTLYEGKDFLDHSKTFCLDPSQNEKTFPLSYLNTKVSSVSCGNAIAFVIHYE